MVEETVTVEIALGAKDRIYYHFVHESGDSKLFS